MNKTTLLLLFSFFALTSFCQQGAKHALLIGISQYQDKGWSQTAGAADVGDMYQLLKVQGFPDGNIVRLTNGQATKNAIEGAIVALRQRTNKGDVVVIYFSGHGNTLPDNDGDETSDALDEAIAPYDAPFKAASASYILDDTVNEWITQISADLGNEGHLLFIFDSCFSGEANRSGSSYYKGGSSTAPSTLLSSPRDAAPHDLPTDKTTGAPWVFWAACQSNQSAGHTSAAKENSLFTHALVGALMHEGQLANYQQLNDIVASSMALDGFAQIPWLAGATETGILGGTFKPLAPYCKVVENKTAKRVKINGWPLIHAKVGGKIVFYPLTTGDTLGIAPLATGIIKKLEVPVASVELDLPTPQGVNITEMKAMLRGNHQPAIKVSLPMRMVQLNAVLQKEPYIELKSEAPDLEFELSNDTLKLLRFDGKLLADFPADVSPETVLKRIKKYLAAQNMRRWEAQSDFCDISVVLRAGKDSTSFAFPSHSQHKDQDTVYIHITNNSDKTIYFNVVELLGNDEVGVLYPRDKWKPEHCKIEKKQSLHLGIILFPPGSDMLKIVATTDSPFNLSEAIDANRGMGNPAKSTLSSMRKAMFQPRGDNPAARQTVDIETLLLTISPK